jgi:uncharacterized membrane protein YgdD (TMEM256/DUF423 family)
MKADPNKLRTAALLGFLAVALGAMGAHGLKASWEAALPAAEAAKLVDVWKTASVYHAIHSVVLLVLAYAFPERDRGNWTTTCFTGGILIFSGTLYALCITGMKWLGAITPLGGLLLMTGWLLLALGSRPQAAK